MFGTLGGPEIVLILVIALIVFGPRKLPEIGKTMGKMLAEFRKASSDFKRTIEDEVESEKTAAPAAPALPSPPATVVDAVPVEAVPVEPIPVAPDTPTVSRQDPPPVPEAAAQEIPAESVPAETKQA
jgi:TatA/E family protein of Tat protein translocase